MGDLTGKTAVVTGGTGVLGKAICRGLVEAGAKVAVLATKKEATEAFAAELGKGAIGISADVLEPDALQAAAARVMDEFGTVDILINGAGGNRPQASTTPDRKFFDLPTDAIQWVFNLNLLGTVLTSQAFGKIMAEQKSGAILNISSMTSLRPLTRVLAYGGAKAAVNNFTQWLAVHLALEYSPHIRVNAIAPGFFLTEQNRYLMLQEGTDELTPRGKTILEHTPMRRFGEPDDLVGTVLWLVSDASRFVTGIVVPVDGGFSAFSGV